MAIPFGTNVRRKQAYCHKIVPADRKFFNLEESLGIFGSHHKRPLVSDLEPGGRTKVMLPSLARHRAMSRVPFNQDLPTHI
jgi:hypothetical protein